METKSYNTDLAGVDTVVNVVVYTTIVIVQHLSVKYLKNHLQKISLHDIPYG